VKIPEIIVNQDSINELEKIKEDSLKMMFLVFEKKRRDSAQFSLNKIQYPDNNRSIIFPFFKKLANAKTKKVRIMHYGDSQIEGDRISGRLRERLQKEFGGNGAGLFPLIPATRKISLKNVPTNNWIRKTGFGPYIDKSVDHKKYGALFSFCKMEFDSLLIDSNYQFNGAIAINKPSKSYRLCRDYKTIKIYYTAEEKTIFRMLVNDSVFHTDTLRESSKISLKKLDFSKSPKSMNIQFSSNSSPIIYGISLEGKKGIVVDNIPLRGASGTEFSKVDYSSLSQMQKLLSPDLFILEFGGNTIPYIKSIDRAEKYGSYFKKQILKLKRINPNALVLVIGPADMAKKQKTKFITYPILEDVISALKKAAFETNSCFWDMYLNMGGENSIQEWVNEKPSLASRDYIHFTNAGAKKIADYFIEDFMVDYKNYLKTKDD
tara:strand:+ start:1038 stop:2339 length:1302 start_codon:yes stop_codon:yes gene_type:complete